MNDVNRTELEIHPTCGLKMNLVTDRWIRICIGTCLLLVAGGCFLLAATPFIRAVRWW